MRRAQLAERALQLTALSHGQQYMCRTCLAHANRQFHSSVQLGEDAPSLFKRLGNTLFGSKESKAEEQRRAEAKTKQEQKLAEKAGKSSDLETVTLRLDKAKRLGRYSKPKEETFEIANAYSPKVNKDYKPANTWDGLARIGSEEWVKKQADKGEQYVGYMSRAKAQLSELDWQRLLYVVSTEALTLHQTGRDLADLFKPRSSSWSPETNVRLSTSIQGQVVLDFLKDTASKNILESIILDEEKRGCSPKTILKRSINIDLPASLNYDSTKPTPTAYDPKNTNWMDFEIPTSRLKLAIIKRVAQLTGKPLLAFNKDVRTLQDCYLAFKQNEPIKKLAQTPEMEKLVGAGLPNVTVYKKKRTPQQRDEEIGRQKLIMQELAQRGLLQTKPARTAASA